MKLKNSLKKLKKQKKNVDREKLVHEANKYTYSFQNFQTIRTFGENIYHGNIMLKEADEYQNDLSVEIMDFRKKRKPKCPEKKHKKSKLFLKTYMNLREQRKSS